MRRPIFVAVFASSLVVPSLSFGQDEPASRLEIFEELEIEGQTRGPADALFLGFSGAEFEQIVTIRTSFYDELVKSAGEVGN